MSGAPTTSLLFEGAEFGGAEPDGVAPYGLTATPAGRIATVSGDLAIRQAIVMLLTTMPGERVMRPDYGCPLHRLIFEPNDATTAGLAIHYIRQALVKFEPRISIVSLDAQRRPDTADDISEGATLNVSLTYLVKATNRQAMMDLMIDLEREAV